MHNFAAAQRRYDRRLPAEAPNIAWPNPMEILREDLTHRLAAQDIASAVWDLLNDTDDDINMIRKAAHGDHAGAVALFYMAIQTVAMQRLL